MQLLARLEKNLSCWFLIIISTVFFFLRFPSLFEPYWYGDEGIYQVLGLGMNQGRLLYRDIFDNKPPLLYYLYSLVSSDQFSIRLLSLLFGLLSVFAIFFLARKILKERRPTFIATSIFTVLFGLPLIEGNIANAENFMLLPNILSAILILKSVDQKEKADKYLILSGIILGISFLFKIVAIFDFAAFVIFLIFINFPGRIIDLIKPKNIWSEIRRTLPFIVSFFIPIFLTAIIFILNGAFSYFLQAVLLNNVGYVGYGNKFIIPQGLLILKLSLLLGFLVFIFSKRKLLDTGLMLVSIWLAFSIYDAFFSQRPYTHYVLVLLPSFSLMLGFFFLKTKNLKKFAGILSITTLLFVSLEFRFSLKSIFYYQNFVSFLAGAKSVTDYQNFFDRKTPYDYMIAGYINDHSKSSDNLFIWGNNAQVYTLTNKLSPGRYTVAYHITNYKDGFQNTRDGLSKSNPKFIVVMPNTSPYPFSLAAYDLKIEINKIKIYEKLSY